MKNTQEDLIGRFNRVGLDGKVFTHELTKRKSADGNLYYNHKVYNPFKGKFELIGQFRNKHHANQYFNGFKPLTQ